MASSIVILDKQFWSYFVRPIDWGLTCITTPSQSGIGSNDKEGVFHIPHSFRSVASQSDAV